MYSREKIELFLLATEEVPRVAEPDGVPQEAWIRVGAVQEIVRTPRLLSAWVKRPMRSSSIRAKLLQRKVIQAPQRDYVQFAVPDLDIYLRENAEEILERF